jgi:ElaB/YqjD/DUF883 family membrane-anchored ribosome-binding protein
MTTCSSCGAELRIGEHPFCPHGRVLRSELNLGEQPPVMSDAEISRTAAIVAGVDQLNGKCVRCGHELQIGDYPFCPHGSIFTQFAQHFDPIVLHQAADGSYSFPASVDAPVRPGYRKVEVRTIQEADRVTREVNSREESKAREIHAQSESMREATLSRNRRDMDKLRDRLSDAGKQFAERARQYVDSKPRRGFQSPNFHMDVFSFDSSNREVHRDDRTGWKGRKG